MIRLDRALEQADFIAFPDFEHPAEWRWVGTTLRPPPDTPGFELIMHRDGDGGGFLSGTLSLAPEEVHIDGARGTGPLLLEDASIRAWVPSATGPAVIAHAAIDRRGDARALFATPLDRESAVLCAQALETGAGILVEAVLTLRGLRPMDAMRVTIDLESAYDQLATIGAQRISWAALDVAHAAEALQQAQIARIELVSEVPRSAANLARQRATAQATLNEAVESLFFSARPTLALPSVSPETEAETEASAASLPAPAFGYVLRARDRVLAGHAERYTARDGIARRTVRATRQIRSNLNARVVRVVDDQPSPVPVVAYVPAGADWHGIAAITVDVAREAQHATHVFAPTSAESAQLDVFAKGALYRTSIQSLPLPEPWHDQPLRMTSDWRPVRTPLLEVDPAELRAIKSVRIIRGVMGERYSCVARLDDWEMPLLLDDDHPERVLSVPRGRRLRLDARLHVRRGGHPIIVAWTVEVAPEEDMIWLRPPPDRLRSIQVSLHDPLERLQAAIVEVVDGAALDGQIDTPAGQQTIRLSRDEPDHDVWTPWTSAAPRARARLIALDGTDTLQDWRSIDGPVHWVGDLHLRTRAIEVHLLGFGDVIGVSLTAQVDGFEPVNAVFEAADVPMRLTLIHHDDETTHFSLSVQVFALDGQDIMLEFPRLEDDLVVLTSPGTAPGIA